MGLGETSQNKDMSKLLTVKDIAKRMHLSVAATYQLIHSKEINFYKIGNSIRIREEDFNRYLHDTRVNSIS